jgi:hypothetical protein
MVNATLVPESTRRLSRAQGGMSVTPAQAGVQSGSGGEKMDSGFRRNDGNEVAGCKPALPVHPILDPPRT